MTEKPLRARMLALQSPADLAPELERLGLDPAAAARLVPAGAHRCIRLDAVPVLAVARIRRDFPGPLAADGPAAGGGMNCLVIGSVHLLRNWIDGLAATGDPDLLAVAAAVGDVCHHTMPGAPTLVAPYGRPDLVWEFGRRTYVMSILNVTPDSFSDDGLDTDVGAALDRARQQAADGADVIDVGGESSEARDHHPIPWQEEAERVVPVIRYIRAHLPDMLISVDTWKAPVAEAALAAGSHIINDVGAMRRDPDMAAVAARFGCPIIVMHDQPETRYADIMADIHRFFHDVIDSGVKAGVRPEQVMVDAGFGFGKTVHQDLLVTRRLRELTSLGRPILHAPSRKRTIGRVLRCPDTVEERIFGTAATVAVGVAHGADMVRVHDVLDMTRCVQMTDALLRGYDGPDE